MPFGHALGKVMSNLPKKQFKQLQFVEAIASEIGDSQGQQQCISKRLTIADVVDIRNGNTLIRANTGTGKTWYVLNKLMLEHHVVFLCPIVGQVKQCEEIYGDRDDIAFIYGDKRVAKREIKALAQQNLVMTYDQFERFEAELDKETILVIDECQKLYSAGIYRDKAIQPILKVVKSQKFDRCMFLTATLTDPLFEQLGLHVSHYYDIQKPTELSRNIQIVRYRKPHELNWYCDVFKRLAANREKGQDKLIIIRLNNIAFSKQIKLMLEKQGFKVMLINREEMAHNKCHEMLSLEKLDSTYQVVICTSIMDEAINLNNADEELDSIHVVGQNAHPEEITQFIGRMRKASPPVYIHLSGNIDTKKINPEKMHNQLMKKMNVNFQGLIHFFGNALSKQLNKDSFKGFEDLVSTKMDLAKALNSLTNDIVGCKVYWNEDNKLGLNAASIMGRFYQFDQEKCYQNVHYLKYRLQQVMPHAEVKIVSSDSTVGDDLMTELKMSEEEIKLTKKKVIPEVAQKVVEMLQPRSMKLRQLLTESHEEESNPFQKIDQPMHYEVFQEMRALCPRLDNLVDIVDAIQTERTNKVLKLGYQYQTHPIVKVIMSELSKSIKKDSFKKTLHTYASITALMNKWVSKVSQSRSITALLKEHPLSYLSVDDQGQVSFVDGGSINFLKRYSCVKVLNDKKEHTSKKVHFLDLCAFGYSFCDVPASIQKKYITIDGKEYDASSGRSRKIEEKFTRSFDTLFEDDET